MADTSTPENGQETQAPTPTPPAPDESKLEAPTPTPPTPDESKLGDPGKLALDTERKARRDAEKALKDANARLAALDDKDKSDLQRATERADKAEKAASSDALGRLARSH